LNRTVAYLLERANDPLDELGRCAVHSHDGDLLASVYDPEAVFEALTRAEVFAVHRAEADPRRDLDILLLQQLN
jgi:hypothetical protein